jgi:NOL1/NOP2/fmu family ribosome biogenesis protein
MTPVWNGAGASTHTTSIQWDSSWPAFVHDPQRRAVLSYFEERFGIPLAAFADYRLLERRKVYALVRDSSHLEMLASLKVQSVGLPVLRKMPHHLKPTTAALQRFGHQATRHRVELSAPQMQALLRGEELQVHIDVQPGYVILLYAEYILGCGLYTPGRLRSQIPRRQSAHQRFKPGMLND